MSRKISIIGSGAIGEALLSGIISSGAYPLNSVFSSDISPDRAKLIGERYGIETSTDNSKIVSSADIVILAVKPNLINDVALEVSKHIKKDTVVISVAAGVSVQQLTKRLPKSTKIFRVMPNMPMLVKEGMSVLVPGHDISGDDLAVVEEIFSSVGTTLVVEEYMIDAVTAVSGSGPAYVLLLIEALADAGVRMGLPREIALKLASQTARGSAFLQQMTGEHPARLKDRITSPGGTTIAGLHVLEKGGFRGIISAAVEAATKRSIELRNE